MRTETIKSKRQIIFFIVMIILLIINIICCRTCTHVYSKYNENYRDTIYCEPPGDYKRVYMNGVPSGIVQHGYYGDDDNEYYMVIRRLDNSTLDTIKIGHRDRADIDRGDTILNDNPMFVHDTITIYDTVHIENIGNHKAYVFHGVESGIVVERHCLLNNIKEPYNCTLDIRSFKTSKIDTFKVGKYDYDRINLGDTIYNK